MTTGTSRRLHPGAVLGLAWGVLVVLAGGGLPSVWGGRAAAASGAQAAGEPNQQVPASSPTSTFEPNRAAGAAPRVVAVIRLDGVVVESPGEFFLGFSGLGSAPALVNLLETFEQAARDGQIDAVLLSIEEPVLGWAQVDEVRAGLQRLRQAGKKTYAYAESLEQSGYLVACACDRIVMSPGAELGLTGLAVNAVYFKDLLDKLGLEADFLHLGDSKSAAEPFTRTGPSEAERRQLERLLDDLYGHLVDSIVVGRGLSVSAVRELIDNGPYLAGQARQAGLIDEVLHREAFLKYLEHELGGPVRLRQDYGRRSFAGLRLDNPFAFLAELQRLLAPPPEPAGDVIAVVYIDGPIASGESEAGFGGALIGSRTIRFALNEAGKDPRVKAVVVRINSPGGSATASEVMCDAVRRCAAEKPVVASMGDVAASGGYYVACGAPDILAQATTITGSIGVVGGKIAFGALLDKLGVSAWSAQRGRNADLYSSFRVFNSRERLRLYDLLEQTHAAFKAVVFAARGAKLQGSLEYLAQGQIFSGREAAALGLVDGLGGLQDAIRLAAEKAHVTDYHLRHLPRPKSLAELLDEVLAAAPGGSGSPLAGLAGLSARLGEGVVGVGFPGEGRVRRLAVHVAGMARLWAREDVLAILPYELLGNW